MVICSPYAPHSGKPFGERQTFFQAAADWMNSLSRHGPLLALGEVQCSTSQNACGRIAFDWLQECVFQCRIE